MKNSTLGFLAVVVIAAVLLYSQGQQSAAATPPPGQACADLIAQTMTYQSFDYYQVGTGVVATAKVYDSKGNVLMTSLANTTSFATTQKGSYTLLADVGGYFGTKVPITTDCTATGGSPFVLKLAKSDASGTITFINSDGLTKNAQILYNESITAGTAKQITVRYTPGAQYVALTNPELNVYTVVVNASNASDWNSANWNAIGFDGKNCVAAVDTPTVSTGTVVKAWDCTGNAGGANANIADMKVTYGAQTGAGLTGTTPITFGIYPHDYFADTITGAIGQGHRNNAGTNQTAPLIGQFYYRAG
jgi:hypothetical protein